MAIVVGREEKGDGTGFKSERLTMLASPLLMQDLFWIHFWSSQVISLAAALSMNYSLKSIADISLAFFSSNHYWHMPDDPFTNSFLDLLNDLKS